MELAWPVIQELVAMRERLTSFLESAHAEHRLEPTETASGPHCPAADLFETENSVVVVVELAGVDPDSIDLKQADNRLRVSGVIGGSHRGGGGRLLRMERASGRFFRDFGLPDRDYVGEPSAELRNGVLVARLPFDTRGPRRVAVVEEGS